MVLVAAALLPVCLTQMSPTPKSTVATAEVLTPALQLACLVAACAGCADGAGGCSGAHQLEEDQRAQFLSTAATVMAEGVLAGEVRQASAP